MRLFVNVENYLKWQKPLELGAFELRVGSENEVEHFLRIIEKIVNHKPT